MDNSLLDKHFVLGITGSIAAYKAATLIRLLIKQGAEVQVVITPSGKEFITPVTLAALTSNPVISEFFSRRDGSWHSHVKLGEWADAMIIAPCTASTIGKLANGIADNMLATTYSSMKAPVFIAPAMDLDMFNHPATQKNIETLKSYGNIIIEPAEGELASKLMGKGRMEEPENIIKILEEYFSLQADLSKKKILITAGPTYEQIDPVRFIGNHSTGKMGFALADECAKRGASVILVTGPVNLTTTAPNITRIDVTSAREMLEFTEKHFKECHAAILCAAVADFTPEQPANSKIKRKEGMVLKLKPTVDIAATLGAQKKPSQIVAGFALETDNEIVHARNKMIKKNLDFIVLNSLRDPGACFGHDTNKVSIIDSNNCNTLPLKSKKEVAKDIVNKLSGLLISILLLICSFSVTVAQELNATVLVNSSKIPGTNKDIFTLLQNSLSDFINNRIWTSYNFSTNERISSNFNIIVNKYDIGSEKFECELIVQSSRPVYNSSYNTTVFNYHDTKFDFTYKEQDRLEFNENSVNNNLTAVIAFYCYLIIGIDMDTMSPKGGSETLQQAENVANYAQSLGSGWRPFDSDKSRFSIINDYLNGNLASFRDLQYVYYRKGLDEMAQNSERGRATITESLELLSKTKIAKSTSLLPILFTEIKKDELVNIYSKGLDKERENVANLLLNINPSLSTSWNVIKNAK